MRRFLSLALLLILAAPMALTGPAHAQEMAGGMPDLRTMVGRPMPVTDLPLGAVSIRIARQMPINTVANQAVSATIQRPGEDAIQVEVKSGEDGRATFESLPVGAEFQAETTIDGELLRTVKFTIPPAGGVRMMLIAGIGAPPPPTNQVAVDVKAKPDRGRFDFQGMTGAVDPAADLTAGTVEIRVEDSAGKPLAGLAVLVAEVHGSGDVQAHEGITAENGVTTFRDLPTGPDVLYLAVTELDQLRLASPRINLPDDGGMRVRMFPLAVTDDTSILTVDETSKFIVEPREEFVFIAAMLSFQNNSQKIFDPGIKGLMIPLPTEFTGAQNLGGGAVIEVLKEDGILMRERIMPHVPQRRAPSQHSARFGYMVPNHGEASVEVAQPMPQGMKSPLILVPKATGLSIAGAKKLPDQKDMEGNIVYLYELADVPAGGTLRFTVTGMPIVPRTGRHVASVLVAGLFLWAVLGFRRKRDEAADKRERRMQDLVSRREKLFGQLVSLAEEGPGQGKRAEVVAKLEQVYRDLSDLEKN